MIIPLCLAVVNYPCEPLHNERGPTMAKAEHGEYKYGEYEYVVTSYPKILQPGIGDLSQREIGTSVSDIVQEAVQETCGAMQKSFDGDWEIVSYDLVQLDRFLVTTFLFRRPRQDRQET